MDTSKKPYKKHWFGEKRIGWGWKPVTWQGWIITLLVIAVVGFFTLGFGQFFVLRKAHSTFENYYAFRGCVQLLQKTDTYGTCVTSSGQTIKIVEIGDRWFLDGDGPGVW